MAENTKIQWATHTFNPWIGCQRVSPGCQQCYAEEMMDSRFGKAKWGPNGTRVLTSDANWKFPLKWELQSQVEQLVWSAINIHPVPITNELLGDALASKLTSQRAVDDAIARLAERGCVELAEPGRWRSLGYSRPRVFCASLSDVFEDWSGPIVNSKGEQLYSCPCGHFRKLDGYCRKCGKFPHSGPLTMDDVRRRLFQLIDATPNLNWLVLTKRPENIRRMWPTEHRDTGEDIDDEEERKFCVGDGRVLKRRDNVWLGTSVENQEYADKRIPELLKCRDLSPVIFLSCEPLLGPIHLRSSAIRDWCRDNGAMNDQLGYPLINWVIAGCESGPSARGTREEFFRDLHEECKAARIPFFMKQMMIDGELAKSIDQFPVDLRVQQFPKEGDYP